VCMVIFGMNFLTSKFWILAGTRFVSSHLNDNATSCGHHIGTCDIAPVE